MGTGTFIGDSGKFLAENTYFWACQTPLVYVFFNVQRSATPKRCAQLHHQDVQWWVEDLGVGCLGLEPKVANPSSSHPMESLYSSCMRMEGRFFKNQTYVDTVYIYIYRERCVCMYVWYGMVCYVLFCFVMLCMYVMLCFVLFCNVMYVCMSVCLYVCMSVCMYVMSWHVM